MSFGLILKQARTHKKTHTDPVVRAAVRISPDH